MDGASPDSHGIHPQLRNRMLNRAATFAEGAQPSTPALPRRRSSLASNLSDARYSFGSSTDNLVKPGGSRHVEGHGGSDEPSRWIILPVVAAVVPAIVGLTVDKGADVATDVLILALAGWFLHWCVRVPWDWYQDAQQRTYISDQVGAPAPDDTIHEEDEDGFESPAEAEAHHVHQQKRLQPRPGDAQQEARDALRRTELYAFAACFLGPLLGALLMHTIRGQLMRAEGIVSDANLSIFLLGAEIAPVHRLIEMRRERTMHLQRIVRAPPPEPQSPSDVQQLNQRIAALEERFDVAEPNSRNTTSEVDVLKLKTEVTQTTQLQLDALNRAVRRYEKRHMAQTLQVEARFQALENKYNDALALAAAAARTGQRPGIVAMTVSWIANTVIVSVQMGWDIAMYPFRTAATAVSLAKSMFVRDERQAKPRVNRGKTSAQSAIATNRMQPKPGRA